jgi:hypothetical protein
MTAGRLILAFIPAKKLGARTIVCASGGVIADPEDPLEFRRLAGSLIVDADRGNHATAAAAYTRANFVVRHGR